MVLEETLKSPLDCKEIQPDHPKGNQSWIFIGRTDVEAETPILWPPDVKNWLIENDPDAGKDWRQDKKGTTEDEMVGWHHRLNGHEFEQAPGVGDGQGSRVCCSSWGHKESNTTEWLNWIELRGYISEIRLRLEKLKAKIQSLMTTHSWCRFGLLTACCIHTLALASSWDLFASPLTLGDLPWPTEQKCQHVISKCRLLEVWHILSDSCASVTSQSLRRSCPD